MTFTSQFNPPINSLGRHSGEGRNPAQLFKMQLGFVPQCGACWINWIPAFAGMTVFSKEKLSGFNK